MAVRMTTTPGMGQIFMIILEHLQRKKKLQALRALNSQVTENQSSLKETLYTLFYLVATEIIFLKIKAKIQWCGL